jgi:hypothetical protein
VVAEESVVSQSVLLPTMMQGNLARVIAKCGVLLGASVYDRFLCNRKCVATYHLLLDGRSSYTGCPSSILVRFSLSTWVMIWGSSLGLCVT